MEQPPPIPPRLKKRPAKVTVRRERMVCVSSFETNQTYDQSPTGTRYSPTPQFTKHKKPAVKNSRCESFNSVQFETKVKLNKESTSVESVKPPSSTSSRKCPRSESVTTPSLFTKVYLVIRKKFKTSRINASVDDGDQTPSMMALERFSDENKRYYNRRNATCFELDRSLRGIKAQKRLIFLAASRAK